jgi:hypothetical protein
VKSFASEFLVAAAEAALALLQQLGDEVAGDPLLQQLVKAP